jgi:hypothetical protein
MVIGRNNYYRAQNVAHPAILLLRTHHNSTTTTHKLPIRTAATQQPLYQKKSQNTSKKHFKDFTMSFLFSTYRCQDPSCTDYVDFKISPNSTSAPIPIPYPKDHPGNPYMPPLPHILRNGNALPGVSKPPRRDITDYLPAQYDKMPKPSDAQFEKTDPIRLGIRVPPGFGPRPSQRKDLGLEIVPDYLPAMQNVRVMNQWLWQQKELREEAAERRRMATRQKMEENIRQSKEKSRDGNKGRRDSITDVALSFE